MQVAIIFSLLWLGSNSQVPAVQQNCALWQTSVDQARKTITYRQVSSCMLELKADDPNIGPITDYLTGKFLEEDSVVALDLLLCSKLLTQKIRSDIVLQEILAAQVIKLDRLLDSYSQWGALRRSYFQKLLSRYSVFCFCDVYGEPLSNGWVRVFDTRKLIFGYNAQVPGLDALVWQCSLDKYGLLFVEKEKLHKSKPSFIFSHPDYGRVLILNTLYYGHDVNVPMSPVNPATREQSIWGRVLDDANNPMPQVVISCREVRTPGGGELRWSRHCGFVVTDAQGRFRMCMPMEKLKGGSIRLGPNSKYDVLIVTLEELSIPPQSRLIPIGKESIIRLKLPKLYFRTFAFQDENAPITDKKILERLQLEIRPSGLQRSLYFEYDDIKDGGMFPPGGYKAKMGSMPFEHVTVTEESPSQVVFRRRQTKPVKPYKTYQGRVVYGLTGKPVEGALVICSKGGLLAEATVASLAEQQWQRLAQLREDIAPHDPVLEPLRKRWSRIKKVLVTDTRGRFSITVTHGLSYHFYVIKQDYVPIMHFTDDNLKNSPNEVVELPISKLFPAAKVHFQLAFEHQEENNSFWVYWRKCDRDPCDSSLATYARTVDVDLDRPVHSDLPYTIYVPAELNLRLEFRGGGEYRAAPVYTEMFSLEKGKSLDLGIIDLTQRIEVFVQVTDSAGNPVVGVGVHCDHRSGVKITDKDGLAGFYVPPYYQDSFIITHQDETERFYNESVDYQTNGIQDANSVYTLQLSDEMLRRLFNED